MASVISDHSLPLPGVEAAPRARELARQTHTPLVIFKNGRIERQVIPDAPEAVAVPQNAEGK